MSQNDLVIANQGFPPFRADLNSALQALGSLSSGATEPATKYSYMWWYDTTTDILKMRSQANDAWVNVGSVDQATGVFKLADAAEVIYSVSGTSPVLDPDNGTIQTWTLSGDSTPTENLSDGDSITLMVDDGTASTITWPTGNWINNGGVAPTLGEVGYTVFVLWKVAGVLYFALVGDGT